MIARAPDETRAPEAIAAAMAEHFPGAARRSAHRTSELRNAILVGTLGHERVLVYRLMRFRVPPVSYREGSLLDAIRRNTIRLLDDVQSERVPPDAGMTTRRQLLDRAVEIFPTLVRPTGIVHRLLWPFMRAGTFRGASDEEVSELLGFFLACRTNSSVHAPPTPARQPLPKMLHST